MYERVTPRDWHDAKFAKLDKRVVHKRLWDLENQLEKSTKQNYYVTMGRCKTSNFVVNGEPCAEYTEVYEVAEGVPSDVAIHFGIYDTKEEAEARAAALNRIPHIYYGVDL